MNTYKLSNISLDEFRAFLRHMGCECLLSTGGSGHEKWSKPGMDRPATLQTHISPIPEFIVKNCLRNLGLKRKDYEEYLAVNKKSKKKSVDIEIPKEDIKG